MTIKPLPPDPYPQNKSEILYGVENAVGRGVYFMSNVKERMDIYFDNRAPSIVVEIPEYRNGYIDIRKRGGKIRAFTEITKDNIHHCKQLMKLVDELRHLDGVKGGIAVSESEYMATTVLEQAKPLTQVMYSNVKEVVEQAQYIFDTLWNTAVLAEQKIREIEEGTETIETKILEDKEQILYHMKYVVEKASERSVCSPIGGMQLVYDNFFEDYKKIVDKQRRQAEGKGIRWITCINKDDIDLVKIFLNAGVQIRHVRNLVPMNFAVDSKHFYATIDKMEGGKIMEQLLVSNEPVYIKHYNSIFEEIWKDGVDATERIKDIEAGLDIADIEVIPSSARAQDRYLNIIKTAEEEILCIFPTVNAFIRQDKMGAIPLAIQEAARKRRKEGRNVKVRILVPINRLIEQRVQQLKKEYCYCHASFDEDTITIDVRNIEQMSETKATILVVDRKASLVMELRDDSKTTFVEAIGLSTYSNSKAGVLSYVAIFENLWKQSELYQELMKAHEQLKMHDKMQREFINIAAHELRTPIQPILGLSQVVHSKIKDPHILELQDVIIRNAKRLHRLTEDILDVSRLEGQSLQLNKERFNLNKLILHTIEDFKINIKNMRSKEEEKNSDNINLKIKFKSNNNNKKDIFVVADKGRVTQVISNLLSNAVKFSQDDGIIYINLEQKDEDNKVIISIKDTGQGIDPSIQDKLFEKFVTRSEKGIGLGLYLSRKIIEAHGGKIWGENNNNKNGERGATFYFSLPLSNEEQFH